MTTAQETIPEDLRPDVEAALAWFNGREDVAFEVTGSRRQALALGRLETASYQRAR